MMVAPIAVQLYSLRDALAVDFDSTIRQVAEIGYAGVETAGVYGKDPAYARKLFDSLGLKVSSGHGPLPLGNDRNQVIDAVGTLGCKYWVQAWLPPDQFSSRDQIKGHCERLNEAAEVARANGFQMLYHNHWWEYTPSAALGGASPVEVMVEYLDASVGLEIDVYWVKTGGSDPVAMVKHYASRAPLLHIKDGPAVMDAAMTAVGEGVMDMPAVIAAGQASTDWLIVELDRCDTDMLEAVRKSYTYLTGKGLARGK
ncbi:MAG: TIM barrel protein [Anaerolineae bacterium]|nr:TIM barrel protein [Anaerolineae bacterium]